MVYGRSDATLNRGGIRLGTPAVTTRGMKQSEMAAIADMISEVLLDKGGQHGAVVQASAPTGQALSTMAGVGLAPEPGYQRTQQQLLHQTHLRMRRYRNPGAVRPPYAVDSWPQPNVEVRTVYGTVFPAMRGGGPAQSGTASI